MGLEVLRMCKVDCLLVSVLAEGSLDCSIVVVDVGVVCSSVLLVVELVVVVWRVLF